ncbi:hypothetical protein [Flavobacterium sp.]|uniref:tetratricopeptide repeat protein n=1 Tax=Flavobacterium sp. TaxID=239 RepID=UPI00262AD218|nr:hypothetical protein [Flavobacterium sp.]MDG2433806.1 hypothetical protein [Flavobacterium sp.]
MKKIYFTLILSIIASFSYSQKDQIKQAKVELKNGNEQGAIAILVKWEYLMLNAPYDDKSEFYNLKAEVYKTLADKNIDMVKNLANAVDAYNILLREEKLSSQYKYSTKALESIKKIKTDLQNSASADVRKDKFKDGAEKMYSLYTIDKRDTLNLYLSTSYYMSAKDYSNALKNYKELDNLNYTGSGMQYLAKNNSNNLEELFGSLTERDAAIKAGSHQAPRNENSKSKKNEIYKNIGFIYSLNGEISQAENFYKKSINNNPNFIEPYIDLAYLGLEKKKIINDKISILGTSKQDMVLYDDLKTKMDNEVKISIAYLEKANKIDPKNSVVSDLLLKLYRSMDQIAEYNNLKAKM